MARVVLIVDSETGKLIDVAGNSRENARYYRFAGRMLSADKNPTLNYGINGGDTLTISKNGVKGALINLVADTVKVSGQLKINDQTVQNIVDSQVSEYLDRIKGTEGEISVTQGVGSDGKKQIVISLDESIATTISELSEEIGAQGGALSKYVRKSDLADALADVEEDVTGQEDINAQFKLLVKNLKALVEDDGSSPSA